MANKFLNLGLTIIYKHQTRKCFNFYYEFMFMYLNFFVLKHQLNFKDENEINILYLNHLFKFHYFLLNTILTIFRLINLSWSLFYFSKIPKSSLCFKCDNSFTVASYYESLVTKWYLSLNIYSPQKQLPYKGKNFLGLRREILKLLESIVNF